MFKKVKHKKARETLPERYERLDDFVIQERRTKPGGVEHPKGYFPPEFIIGEAHYVDDW